MPSVEINLTNFLMVFEFGVISRVIRSKKTPFQIPTKKGDRLQIQIDLESVPAPLEDSEPEYEMEQDWDSEAKTDQYRKSTFMN